MHQEPKEKKTVQEVECDECFQTFTSETRLARHKSRNHENVCNDCGKRFASERLLRLHVIRVHEFHGKQGVKRNVSCDQCDKSFLFPKSLENHKLKKHSSKPQNGATGSHKLKKEMSINDTDPLANDKNANVLTNTQCNHCDKIFKSSKRLENHKLKKHSSGPQDGTSEIHVCNFCKKEFSSSHGLQIHKSRKHPNGDFEVEENANKKPLKLLKLKKKYQCDSCNEKFHTAKGKTIHTSRIHLAFKQPKVRMKMIFYTGPK